MGVGTLFAVMPFVDGYEVNAQDYQRPLVDGVVMRQDTVKPVPITLAIDILINRARRPGSNGFGIGGPGLRQLLAEWDAPATRLTWGAVKPLLFCDGDGVTWQWFGRPGKLSYQMDSVRRPTHIQVTAEYRRTDAYRYSGVQTVRAITGTSVTIDRTNVDTATPVQITVPAGSPTITVGDVRIKLNAIPEPVTISSYPWQQGVLDANGHTFAGKLEFDGTHTPFLSDLLLPAGESTLITSTLGGTVRYYDRQYAT